MYVKSTRYLKIVSRILDAKAKHKTKRIDDGEKQRETDRTYLSLIEKITLFPHFLSAFLRFLPVFRIQSTCVA